MNNPNIESLKEVGRYALFFVVSWFITATLAQINLIPESYNAKIADFTYAIPIRFVVQFGLTGILRYIDKYLFVNNGTKLTGF